MEPIEPSSVERYEKIEKFPETLRAIPEVIPPQMVSYVMVTSKSIDIDSRNLTKAVLAG